MVRIGAWLCVALSPLAGVGGALWLWSLELPDGAVAPGVTIAGVAVASRDPAAVVDELTRRVGSIPVDFSLGSEPSALASATLADLGVAVDREATLRRARSIGRRGSPLQRWRELSAVRAHGLDVPLELAFDRLRVFRELEALKLGRDRAPLPARYPHARRSLVPHVPGRYLDLERAADVVWTLARTRARQLAPPGWSEPRLEVSLLEVLAVPRVNADVLGDFEPKHVLAEYSTRFRVKGDQAARAANIAVAASRIDGLLLLPGDRVSFNTVVGERSIDNGFLDSWELLEGEFVRGVGGGTCQVSSTLNAAALRAGLDIIEAYTHSRPLAYIEKGLDATVAWPFVDLQLENPWPLPVAIQASVVGNTLTVRVLAQTSPGRVSLRSEVKETYPFPRVVEVGRVPRGSFKRKQEGIPGFRILRTRVIQPLAGEARREVVYKRYRPTPELFLVAPDFDVRELPPLPEGAEGYEPVPPPADDGAGDIGAAREARSERDADGPRARLTGLPRSLTE